MALVYSECNLHSSLQGTAGRVAASEASGVSRPRRTWRSPPIWRHEIVTRHPITTYFGAGKNAMNKRPFQSYVRPASITLVVLGALIGAIFGVSSSIITGEADHLAYSFQQTAIFAAMGCIIVLGVHSNLLGTAVGALIGLTAGVLGSIFVRHGMTSGATINAFFSWIILGAFFGSLISIGLRLLRRLKGSSQ